MRIVHQEYDISIELEEGCIEVLCVENPKAFTVLVGDMLRQNEGGEGGWILSDKDKVLQMGKCVTGIIDPFNLDCNERRILSRVYSELNEKGTNEYCMQTAELNGKIVEYLDLLCQSVTYQLDMQMFLDVTGLLKLYDVKMDNETEKLVDKIINYLKAMHRICKIGVYCFVNIKMYLTGEELTELYKFANYEKLTLLLLEGHYEGVISPEKCWIFDTDLCMIEV